MSTSMFPVPQGAQSSGASDVKWFAGLAMQSIIALQGKAPESSTEREEIALWSYRMAQAMVAAEKRLHVSDPME